ncbi:MAG: hypothetical protein NWE98_00095 [Candidatus Bathyarchaeota archaeon]|nr:hypothetical protein [Candidatus Bathyarchaeota archaeon]
MKVEVFVPFGSCACSFASLMEKVGRVTSSFKDTVEVQMRSTASKEAGAYAVEGTCVIVDGNIKLQADFDEKKLEEAIKQRIANKQSLA